MLYLGLCVSRRTYAPLGESVSAPSPSCALGGGGKETTPTALWMNTTVFLKSKARTEVAVKSKETGTATPLLFAGGRIAFSPPPPLAPPSLRCPPKKAVSWLRHTKSHEFATSPVESDVVVTIFHSAGRVAQAPPVLVGLMSTCVALAGVWRHLLTSSLSFLI